MYLKELINEYNSMKGDYKKVRDIGEYIIESYNYK